ncbi:hypothetical protein F4780DRAFT_405044 [Xylariomycetidae sp. FL0641]|nr:hypothetical protein F4780DRAFT_405044 [Xylariomycetidae sp. FL0641]
MRFSNTLAVAAAASTASAQRPSDTPICDYYTKALLKENTAENQATLLTLVVNTVVIGNYTMPNVGIKVPGILAPGEYNGEKVNLLPYFNGELASSNRGGDSGVAVNFLDGGGAEPLMMNKPADNDSCQQYFLLTHLYQFFGSLLGCTEQGMPGFDAYTGHASMYEVHKFMDLDAAEFGYFVQQVGLAAASFGVADADVKAVGAALNTLFGYRCAPPATAVKAQGPQLQSICVAEDCPLAHDAVCARYDDDLQEPKSATSTLSAMPSSMMPAGASSWSVAPMPTMSAGSMMNATGSMTGTMSSPTMIPTAAAAANGFSIAAAAGGLAAFFL